MHYESHEFSPSVEVLGIIIDDNRTWYTHMKHISKRYSRLTFLLRRLLYCVPEI